VQENVAGTADHVTVNGNRRHVLSYLSDFLFPPERARTPVRVLSGGERNRLLLARLFTRSFNLLVMDEPTNDLDAETLELLEALLVEFPGTVLLVSHDRAFLDEVVTSTLVLEGGGKVGEYVGGYEDWRRQTGGRVRPLAKPPRQAARTAAPARSAPAVRKLTLKERRELEQLPQRIEALEAEQAALHVSLADPALHRAGTGVVAVREKLAGVERELAEAFARWEALEALA
jgi:ATP-binding cassette subfamily F protein uup